MLYSGRRKILRDITSRKVRTFLVSASILVGVLGVIALFTTSDVIGRQLAEDVQESQLTMIDLAVSIDNDAELDNALYLETLNRQNQTGQSLPALDGIETVEGWAYYAISFKKPTEEKYQTGEIRAYSVPLQDVVLEPMRLVEGDWAEVGQHQVMLEQRLVDKFGYAVGDEIVFRVAGETGVTGVTYMVSGIVFHPYSTSGIADEFPGPTKGIYMQYDDAQALLNFHGLTTFVARYRTFEQAQAKFQDFVRTVDELTPYVPVVPSIENPADNQQVANAKVFTDILNSLALATMIVSGFLVVNVINTIIAEQKRQIGVLKSLGATRWENFLIYSGIAFLYGLIGTVLAIVPGVLIAQSIIAYLAPELDLLVEGFKWSPSAVVIGVILGLLIPVLSAALPVYNGTRVTIMEAMTDLGISGDFGEGWVSHLIAGLPLPIGGRQAVSNVWQKRSRLALTGTTLTLTVAMFMGVSALAVSLNNEIHALFDRLGYEIIMIPNGIQDIETIETAFADVPEVDHISPASIVFVQLPGDYINFFTGDNQIQVFGIDPTSDAITLDHTDGDGWDKDPRLAGVSISSSVARQLDVQAGDTLELTIGGRIVDVPIIGVDSGAFDAMNMRWDYMSELAGIVKGAPTPNHYTVFLQDENVAGIVVGIGWDENELQLMAPQFDFQNSGVVISGDFAAAGSYQIGDMVTLTVDGQSVTREVSGVVANAQLEALSGASVPPYLVMFGFNDLVEITGVSTDGEPVPNAYYVTLKQAEATASQTADAIDTIQVDMLDKGIPARYINQVENGDLAVAQVNTNTSILMVAVILIAVVGAIGLLTTLTISVFERQKEIGVMRSIGAGSGVITFQFMLEGIIIAFIAWVIGLVPSYYIALMFNKIAHLENVTFRYSPLVPLIGLIGIISVSALASLGPSLSAARKTVSDILRYQ